LLLFEVVIVHRASCCVLKHDSPIFLVVPLITSCERLPVDSRYSPPFQHGSRRRLARRRPTAGTKWNEFWAQAVYCRDRRSGAEAVVAPQELAKRQPEQRQFGCPWYGIPSAIPGVLLEQGHHRRETATPRRPTAFASGRGSYHLGVGASRCSFQHERDFGPVSSTGSGTISGKTTGCGKWQLRRARASS